MLSVQALGSLVKYIMLWMNRVIAATLLCCLALLAGDKPKSEHKTVQGVLVSKQILEPFTWLEVKSPNEDTAYTCIIREIDRRFALSTLGDTFVVNGIMKGGVHVLHRCDIVSWKQSSH
jgi:hypothetical protein